MKIAIGSDHAGFRYKERLKERLVALGHEVTDFGTRSAEPIDYPLVVRPVAEAVASGRFERGIVLGGSGNGEAIVANRMRGVRCAVCWNVESARLARLHNDANLLSLGERLIDEEELLPIVDTWLTTAFEGGRHVRRLALIDPATVRTPSPPAWPWPGELDALSAAPRHHTLLLENDRVRVLETRIPPGDLVPVHTHCWPSVLYVLGWSDFVRRDPSGTVALDSRAVAALAAPSVVWSDPLPPHSLENVGAAEIRILSVELKQAAGLHPGAELGRLG